MPSRVHASFLDEHGRLKRRPDGGSRLPGLELSKPDVDLLEQFLIDNDLMEDIPSAIRIMMLGTIRDPRWAIATVDRRRHHMMFRRALYQKVQAKFEEIRAEMDEELAALDVQLSSEVNPNAD